MSSWDQEYTFLFRVSVSATRFSLTIFDDIKVGLEVIFDNLFLSVLLSFEYFPLSLQIIHGIIHKIDCLSSFLCVEVGILFQPRRLIEF